MSVLDDFIGKNEDEAVTYARLIESMLEDYESYGYAEDTLAGILDNVEENGRITDGQKQAVKNIQAKPSEPYYGRRRY